MTAIPISEIFGPTVQGEGAVAGLRTMFIRTAACDGVSGIKDWCDWCDSMHAVDTVNKGLWRWMEPVQIKDELHNMAPWCQEVTISGGNPLIHDLDELVNYLIAFGYSINVETQGTVYRSWLAKCDTITISPKPPSAGPTSNPSHYKIFLNALLEDLKKDELEPEICTKVVVGDSIDLDFAKEIFHISRSKDHWIKMYLSVLTDPSDTAPTLIAKYKELIQEVACDKQLPDVYVLPQLHVLVWGHKIGV